MKSVLTAGLIICLASPLMAENATEKAIEKAAEKAVEKDIKDAIEKAPASSQEKQSYAIGANVGSSLGGDLKNSGIEIDNAMLLRGLRDGINGKIALSEEERSAAMQEVMQKAQAGMEARQREMEAENEKAGAANKAASEKFLAENKAKEGVKTTASGLQYKEGKTGDGPKPKADDVVEVHYRGTLIDGTEFDSSYKRNESISFPLNGVIPGWTEGLQLMPVGSKWTLYIPSELAYGKNAPPSIGPDQALVFEVELLGIKKKD